MAIVNSMWMKSTKKRLGGTVIYQAMGQTRQRELATIVTNPRTEAQMNQRVKWANLVNFYRANRSWMKYAFETKKTNQSEYNKFMSLNVTNSRIYLPKNVAAAGGCVVDSYLITQGSLPSIESIERGIGWTTNILLGPEAPNFSTITIGKLSSLLVQYNPAIREGDQLSFIRLTQQTSSDTGTPYIVVREYELIVNSQSNELFKDYFPADYFAYEEGSPSSLLAVQNRGNAGGWALILSRTISGKTYVSTQRVVVANNSQLINYYSSSAALQAAVDSYGSSEDAFLSSVTANESQSAPVLLSIISLQSEDTDETWVAGSRAESASIEGGFAFVLTMNSNITENPTNITLSTNKGTFSLIDLERSGSNKVRGNIALEQSVDNFVVFYATVTFQSGTYRIDFQVRNSDTVEGLE
jgi:hypothetical protein